MHVRPTLRELYVRLAATILRWIVACQDVKENRHAWQSIFLPPVVGAVLTTRLVRRHVLIGTGRLRTNWRQMARQLRVATIPAGRTHGEMGVIGTQCMTLVVNFTATSVSSISVVTRVCGAIADHG